MSEIIPLEVTLELPESEMMDHEGAILVRCQNHRAWIAMSDYYSEKMGSLLPLVGNVSCECGWKETVRVLELDDVGFGQNVLEFNVDDSVNSKEKFG